MKTEYVKRYLFFFTGLFIMSIGVAFSIKANLGTSPISSVPYVLSLVVPMTVGVLTIAMHCVFILLQVLILRENYQLVQLMQLPVAVAFGMMIDFAVWLLGGANDSSYLMRILVECGLVNVRKEGKWSHYSLNCETLQAFKAFMDSLSCCKGDNGGCDCL